MNNYLKIGLVIVNILGFMTFPIYYGSQIMKTNSLLWILVPDCQLSALLFALALLIDKEWIKAIGFASAFKYGLWTILAMTIFINYFLTPADVLGYFIVVISHIFLLGESLLLIKDLKIKKSLAPAFVFLFVNDLSDYILGTHPLLPSYGVALMSVITPLITASELILLFTLRKYFFVTE